MSDLTLFDVPVALAVPPQASPLTPSQARVLDELLERGQRTAAEVATATGYQQNAASRRLGELCEMGLARVIAQQEGPRGRWLRVYVATGKDAEK